MIRPTDTYRLMNDFTTAVSVEKDRGAVATMLSENVEFVTVTDDSKKSVVGLDNVLDLFEKYIWSNTEQVSILSYSVKDADTMTPKTKMTVLEKKARDGKWEWHKFKLVTKHELTVQDNALVISRLETIQKQQYTPDRTFTPWKSYPSDES